MPIVVGEQKQIQKSLPQSQLTGEQKRINSQPIPIPWRRNISKENGVLKYPRTK